MNPVDTKKKEVHLFLINTYALTSCLNCCHFKHLTQQCDKWKATPPPKVAVVGCDSYSQDIPF